MAGDCPIAGATGYPYEREVVLLTQAEEARREADAELDTVLAKLGFAGWQDT